MKRKKRRRKSPNNNYKYNENKRTAINYILIERIGRVFEASKKRKRGKEKNLDIPENTGRDENRARPLPLITIGGEENRVRVEGNIVRKCYFTAARSVIVQ